MGRCECKNPKNPSDFKQNPKKSQAKVNPKISHAELLRLLAHKGRNIHEMTHFNKEDPSKRDKVLIKNLVKSDTSQNYLAQEKKKIPANCQQIL